MPKPNLEYWEETVPKICPFCQVALGPIQHYPHSAGWTVDGFKDKQWLYRVCTKCRYQWAIWKLGIPREAP